MTGNCVTVNLGERQVEVCLDTLDGLRLLADCISTLTIPEKTRVHAEKMKNCKEDEYSLSFYEVVEQLMFLLKSEYSLEDAVATITDEIPSVEDIPYALKWGSCITVTRKELLEHAAKFQNKNLESTDGKLAKRILSKKASVADWKLYALHFADFHARTTGDGRDFWAFFSNEKRAILECTELKKYTRKVAVKGNEFNLERPHHPPWTDVGIWIEDWYGRGFGRYFALEKIFGENDSSEEDEGSSWATDDEHDSAVKVTTEKDRVIECVVSAADVDTTKNLPLVEWPSLPNRSVKAVAGVMDKPGSSENVWTARTRKRGFMNIGIADKHRKLEFKPSPTVESEYVIDIAKAYSIVEVWGFALLGQYVGRFPGHKSIKDMINTWGVNAKYRIEEGWLIFNFDTIEDKDKILIGGPYMINGRLLIVKDVPEKFSFTNEDFATVPLWMRIHGLGTRFWTDEFLGGIASYVGKPLYMDPVTDGRKRNSYARLLVEINLAEQVVRKVPVKFSDGQSYVCKIQIENEPKFCKERCAFGHCINECSFVKRPVVLNNFPLQNDLTPRTVDPNAKSGHKRVHFSAAAISDHSSLGINTDGLLDAT